MKVENVRRPLRRCFPFKGDGVGRPLTVWNGSLTRLAIYQLDALDPVFARYLHSFQQPLSFKV